MEFWTLFGAQKQAKISQHGLPKRSKRANIAISSDCENVHFINVLQCLQRQTSQKTPKTSQKPPKMAPGSLREHLKKRSVVGSTCQKKRTPKQLRDQPDELLKTSQKLIPQKIHQIRAPTWTPDGLVSIYQTRANNEELERSASPSSSSPS